MYPYRITTRAVPRACRQGASPCNPSSNNNRNIFTSPFLSPAHHFNPSAEFNGLFRLLDSAATEFLPNVSAASSTRAAQKQHFTPRFDVKEVGGTYELQGEVPGIRQKDLEIEFVDERTLVIRGRAEREVKQGNAQAVEGAAATDEAVEHEHDNDAASQHSANSANYHKASVEDEEYVDAGAEADATTTTAEAAPDAESSTETVKAAATEQQPEEPAQKYWVSERSVGQFERRFAFPGRVDQDAVTASLKNGILSVVVPKIVEKGTRRIEVL